MATLIFEKVGDINSTYSYLCVYEEDDKINPFMEISITDDKKLEFVIYKNLQNVILAAMQWEEIQVTANAFFIKTLANEDGL